MPRAKTVAEQADRPKTGRDVAAEIAYLTRAMKAPNLLASVERLAERARAENWTHEEFLAACLQREVSARDSSGGEQRIRSARFLFAVRDGQIVAVSEYLDAKHLHDFHQLTIFARTAGVMATR